MKKLTITASAILIMVIFSATAAAQTTEIRNLSGFTKVDFGVPGDLNIRIGSEFKVTLEGDNDILEETVTEVSNDRLVIKRKDNRPAFRLFKFNSYSSSFNNKRVIVNITMPAISGLSVSGSGRAEVIDSFTAGSLNLSVSGSGQLKLNSVSGEDIDCRISGSGRIVASDIKARSLNLSTTGSGRITLNDVSCENLNSSITGSGSVVIEGKGSIGSAKINISGSGRFTGESVPVEAANISVTGSGRCSINVTNSLEARVSGSGNITYLGNPQKIDTRVTGSGRVSSR
jgi:hypothetical protein